MTNDKLVEMVVILDNSGSMEMVKSDTIGNVNRFLKEQRELQTDVNAKLTLIIFNTSYEVRHDGIDIKDVPELNGTTYTTMGMTALYDALGRAIDTVGARLANTPEDQRPGKVIVTIITDGQENSSHEYSKQQINDKIKQQETQFGWSFIYLSASPTAFTDSGAIGISSGSTMSYDIRKGTGQATRGMSAVYCATRTGKKTSIEDILSSTQ